MLKIRALDKIYVLLLLLSTIFKFLKDALDV